MADREDLRGNPGTAVDSLRLGMGSPHSQGLGEVPEGALFTLSPVRSGSLTNSGTPSSYDYSDSHSEEDFGGSHRLSGSHHGDSGYSYTASHNTHRQSSDSLRKQSRTTHGQSVRKHFQSPSTRNHYVSSQHWRHGSYGRADYDYGQSGYGPSGGSRTSSRNSSPLRSAHQSLNTHGSRYGQSLSLSQNVGSTENEGMGGLLLKYGESDLDHGQPVDYYNLTESCTTGKLVSSHGHSVVTSEQVSDCDANYGYSVKAKPETTQSQSTDQSVFGHTQYISFQEHSESNSIGNQSEFSTYNRQACSHGQPSDNQLSSDSRNRNQKSFPSNSLQSLYCMGTEECKYLPSTTTLGAGRQGQGPGSHTSGIIRKISQYVDDKKTRDSESRGYHESKEIYSGSAYVDSNTPLYTYVQEQRHHYFD
ncbi:filaggrin-2-like [Phodopus roborovskii]|uniref:filaggrin-2-like n=1 Tax=Phodopus roborovskii TaxID=109678 RepID=UPI0021E47EB8|nr:filaggrin-2-like [Phodopus roborovskii]